MPSMILPEGAADLVAQLSYFIVENEKSARKFLKSLNWQINQQHLKFLVFNKHEEQPDWDLFLEPLLHGHHAGMISEAGCPAIADPGSGVVRAAHLKNIKVIPLTGPSSIILALMASGLNGQRFCFHGYLPIDTEERVKKIKSLEADSKRFQQTQIFIETPYRNKKLFDELLHHCKDSTWLSISVNLTLPDEFIATKRIAGWKNHLPNLQNSPAVFSVLSE